MRTATPAPTAPTNSRAGTDRRSAPVCDAGEQHAGDRRGGGLQGDHGRARRAAAECEDAVVESRPEPEEQPENIQPAAVRGASTTNHARARVGTASTGRSDASAPACRSAVSSAASTAAMPTSSTTPSVRNTAAVGSGATCAAMPPPKAPRARPPTRRGAGEHRHRAPVSFTRQFDDRRGERARRRPGRDTLDGAGGDHPPDAVGDEEQRAREQLSARAAMRTGRRPIVV